ncbi:MAG: HPr-rel-A system PqqD family peptide chaperone [Gemmatimonadetes bacterium]|uniref:HPr-rel-A system PqqD family peptide chaperone n=1 Tax=Candidatus Kutchimonas denitrificans TaxID=3056748 RepID=A0AAE4Z5G4_9BACT|nr:HPr-rel-A system PqqD family peptide chaperone [Gemmatimonadota bacterium]NIR74139.1 HPr-rel-A system PqqD family peptide chaperone [Candidatus Kutchimonas denitrificans]NIS01321.1 HPr-rel-A system PqqD family peptide chaperone [Gemmatimonadota bacterium]NIT67052.1 HPr-rel-A system PqqD family peptide chaperone [Gemmatimonadota bacterium]NIU51712.1 HPr-rel-A system PqqD family peptide chaperone [Gemmatimonadota bacterium]
MFRQVDEDWVVFDPAANNLHVLNLTAALIWSHLDGEHSPREISQTVLDAFGIDADRAAADVEAALERFRAAGLLTEDA